MVAPVPAGRQAGEARVSFAGIHSRSRGFAPPPVCHPFVPPGGGPSMSAKVQGWAWDQDLLPQRKLLLLWLANRATDAGVCFPAKRELAQHTGLGERMVRYHLAWLASDQDEDGQPKTPLLQIIERPVGGERNTSNVYVLRVPWAQPEEVRAELAEFKHM